MTKVLVEDSNLTSIANAIREKNGQTTQYKPSEMGKAIEEMPKGATLGQKTITENGVYNAIDDGVDGYDVVTVETEKYAPRFISFADYTGTELDYEISNLEFSNITDATNMFRNCKKLTNIPYFNIGNITNIS